MSGQSMSYMEKHAILSHSSFIQQILLIIKETPPQPLMDNLELYSLKIQQHFSNTGGKGNLVRSEGCWGKIKKNPD